jgi:hypothetical protein
MEIYGIHVSYPQIKRTCSYVKKQLRLVTFTLREATFCSSTEIYGINTCPIHQLSILVQCTLYICTCSKLYIFLFVPDIKCTSTLYNVFIYPYLHFMSSLYTILYSMVYHIFTCHPKNCEHK